MQWGGWLFGPEDEVKVKQFKALFDIKDDEVAKKLYTEVKTKLETK